MKKILVALLPWAQGVFIAIIAMVMIDFYFPGKKYTYPSYEKLESQGFKKLPGETPEEHEKRGHSVIDYARSIPG